jgi:hypothetical protein
MPEPSDAVLPILRCIKADIAEIGAELGRKIDVNAATLASHGEKVAVD